MKLLSRRQAIVGAAGVGLVGCRTETQRASAEPKDEQALATKTGSARLVEHVIDAQPTRDGAGVKLSRALGGRALPMLDPFLLLDEFHSDDPNDYAAGFPDHPHRGFETVTYMLEGAMEHKDSVGNSGRLRPGSAQWMTAGRGIVHSEMPKQERGLMWGFQLWVNLPRARKMIKPRYQDIAPDRIPELDQDGARVRVVAGTAFGATGPITASTSIRSSSTSRSRRACASRRRSRRSTRRSPSSPTVRFVWGLHAPRSARGSSPCSAEAIACSRAAMRRRAGWWSSRDARSASPSPAAARS